MTLIDAESLASWCEVHAGKLLDRGRPTVASNAIWDVVEEIGRRAREKPCDGSTTCPAVLHRGSCYGLYRTEEEVAADIYPDMQELERRRDQEQTLRRVSTLDSDRNYGIGESHG